jgi:organizing structure protein 2
VRPGFLISVLNFNTLTTPKGRVKSIISPSEPLTPGILYVGIATLTGSIISRTRGLPTRLVLPPILFLASFQHFLPKTGANLGAYISSIERAHFPALAEKHREAEKRMCDGWRSVKKGTREGNEKVVESVNTAVKRLQGFTGLKLQEAFALQRGFMATTAAKALESPSKEPPPAEASPESSAEEKAPAKATKLV